MKNASFSLMGYRFPKASIDLSNLKCDGNSFAMNIIPSGKFNTSTREFDLKFIFTANLNDSTDPAISVECEAFFQFADPISFEDIPEFFFPNSIAIIFPYVRAFVSTLSLQANYNPPIIIPTMNLSDLSDELRRHVVVE
jgi:preprotein translocase subunit SecB